MSKPTLFATVAAIMSCRPGATMNSPRASFWRRVGFGGGGAGGAPGRGRASGGGWDSPCRLLRRDAAALRDERPLLRLARQEGAELGRRRERDVGPLVVHLLLHRRVGRDLLQVLVDLRHDRGRQAGRTEQAVPAQRLDTVQARFL